MVVHGKRILLSLFPKQLCVLDHDGSRVATAFHFNVTEGLEDECPRFSVKRAPVFFPHPHLRDRFFASIPGVMDLDPPAPEPGKSGDSPPYATAPDQVPHVVVREFDGASHVATYHHEIWKVKAGNMLLDPRADVEAIRRTIARLDAQVSFSDGTVAPDARGSYVTCGFPVRRREQQPPPTAADAMAATGFSYAFSSFNTVERDFDVQVYTDPMFDWFWRGEVLWENQGLLPCVPRPDVLRLRRFDAQAVGFSPAQEGERKVPWGWEVEVQGIEEHMASSCMVFNDEDFVVLAAEWLGRYFVWGFEEK